jgi:hypothetical protein
VRANVRAGDGFALEPAYEFPPLRLALGDRLAGRVIFPRDERLPAILQSSEHVDPLAARQMERTFERVWLVRVARQSAGPLAEGTLTAELDHKYRLVRETRIVAEAGEVDIDLYERKAQSFGGSPGNARSRA